MSKRKPFIQMPKASRHPSHRRYLTKEEAQAERAATERRPAGGGYRVERKRLEE